MATLNFGRAVKSKAKLRLALFGPSGAGKTYSALAMATGMGKKIALIDTERGSASLYADRFEFAVLELPNFRIETYIEAMEAAQEQGYDVLIIDSLSHAWQQLLDEVNQIAKARFNGNTWSAWSEGTPMQRKLVDALLSFNGHIIATIRSRTEWVQEENSRGKKAPTRVGLAPEQGKGIEYEFSMLMELSTSHHGTFIKDRTGKFQDQIIEKPGAKLGQALIEWLQSDKLPEPEPEPAPAPEPEEKPKAAMNGYIRPYDPDTLKRGLTQLASKGSPQPASPGLLGAMNGALGGLWHSDSTEIREKKRHMLLKWITGNESSKALSTGWAHTLLDWAQNGNEIDGYIPNDLAIQEAAKIINAMDVAEGQQPLL